MSTNLRQATHPKTHNSLSWQFVGLSILEVDLYDYFYSLYCMFTYKSNRMNLYEIATSGEKDIWQMNFSLQISSSLN